MNLVALPAFTDNYIWMLHDGHAAVVVDPGDAVPVERALDRLGLELQGILVTHHHGDHAGGVQALLPRLEGPVLGPARESIGVVFDPVRDGDRIEVLGVGFEVFDVPGHTAGHVAYLQRDAVRRPLVFSGDTLFSAGCGRLFEGTPAQMAASLARLAELAPDTRVCCTHEYTLSNLRFAAAVEPDNAEVREHLATCARLRAAGVPTLPSTIGLERAINPFLRCHEAPVARSAAARGALPSDPVSVFATLREWKNQFR